MSELLTLEIESIAAGGDGVARHDGLVVFVPRTAPGDRVLARVTQKGRLARGVVERVERPAPQRVPPQCVHYDRDRCGGCQLQHLTLETQREAKSAIIRDSMRRIGRREVPLPEMRAGSRAWRYREKLTLALRREGGRLRAGLRPYDDPDGVFALEDCLISDERVIAVWRDILAVDRLLPAAPRLRGAVRLLGGGAAFVLEGAREWGSHGEFFSAVPSITELWWIPDQGSRVLLHERGEHAEPGASFAQVNSEVGAQLSGFVVGAVMAHSPRTVVDAYAGSGGVARDIASRGVAVTAIELDAEASRWSAAQLPPGSRAVTGRVEDTLAGALPADVVLLNPPRTGLGASVAQLLAVTVPRPRAIVYVSCDPATLARDVARLTGWRVSRLTAFDMFPQTAHVETVCELEPGEAT